MSVIRIAGLHRLEGEVEIQGSKNAVLPVMAASLLHRGVVRIRNVPGIQDVFCMMEILRLFGCRCSLKDHVLLIDAGQVASARIPDGCCKSMRSSIMLLGPLLGRLGEAHVTHPGGCSIGARPIDLHLEALRLLGAEISVEGEEISARAGRLSGTEIRLRFPSVGATENILMAAAAAEGTTCIRGAAREPEILVLCEFLEKLGVGIRGAGSGEIWIEGCPRLREDGKWPEGAGLRAGAGRQTSIGCSDTREPLEIVMPGDRIVAGTYLGAVLAAGGEAVLRNAPAGQLTQVLTVARAAGGSIFQEEGRLMVRQRHRARPFSLATGPYPSFPTDLQSVMLAVASTADGSSQLRETIFEGRFATAGELQKMGAHIIIKDRTAYVAGRARLSGSRVEAKDLRGGAALVAAALAAEGESRIGGYSYIARGYEDICRDLGFLGADICLEEPPGA